MSCTSNTCIVPESKIVTSAFCLGAFVQIPQYPQLHVNYTEVNKNLLQHKTRFQNLWLSKSLDRALLVSDNIMNVVQGSQTLICLGKKCYIFTNHHMLRRSCCHYYLFVCMTFQNLICHYLFKLSYLTISYDG